MLFLCPQARAMLDFYGCTRRRRRRKKVRKAFSEAPLELTSANSSCSYFPHKYNESGKRKERPNGHPCRKTKKKKERKKKRKSSGKKLTWTTNRPQATSRVPQGSPYWNKSAPLSDLFFFSSVFGSN
jgi:hypothetical protein